MTKTYYTHTHEQTQSREISDQTQSYGHCRIVDACLCM